MATMRLQNARLRALSEFPLADAELVNSLTDLEQIAAHAQRTHTREEAHRTELETLRQQQRQGNGTPLPPTNSATVAETEKEARLRKWRQQVRSPIGRRQIDVLDAEEASGELFKAAWNQHMAERKEMGMKSTPPVSSE